VKDALLAPWMVTLVVARELVVTGLRSYFESRNTSFGADMFGKVKMVLQCAALIAIFIALSWPSEGRRPIHVGLIYAMVVATALSGLQYVIRAVAIFSRA